MLPAAVHTGQTCCGFTGRTERWGLAKNLATCAGEPRENGEQSLEHWQSVCPGMGWTNNVQLMSK